MRTEVKTVVGTNAWGDALYGKMLRGSYVEEDVIREAVQTAIGNGKKKGWSAGAVRMIFLSGHGRSWKKECLFRLKRRRRKRS